MTIPSLLLAISCLGLRHPVKKILHSIAASLKVTEDITLMEDKEKAEKNLEKENQTDDVFAVKEIIVEEIAVDGICGVY